MSGESALSPSNIVELNPIYIMRWEETEQAYLLLYPEGIIKLNSSAAEILKRCDGARPLRDIIDDLKATFGADDIEADVTAFLEIANDKGWIRPKA